LQRYSHRQSSHFFVTTIRARRRVPGSSCFLRPAPMASSTHSPTAVAASPSSLLSTTLVT